MLECIFIHNRGVDEPVALIHDGEKYFYHQNRFGNVIAITDSTGTVKERYEYGPYGKVSIFDGEGNALEQSSIGNSITYTGQRYDADTGLYYYKNRYYSPKLGRFMSKDPLGMVDGPNLYAYVNNDPLNWTDPMGTTTLASVGNSDINILADDGTAVQDEAIVKINNPSSSGQSAGDCDYELRKLVEDNDLYKDFDRLNDKEKMLVLLNPIAAYEVREARIKAEFATRKRFPDVKVAWNNQADAYRHAYWNAEMTRRMGMSLAEKFATAHEAGENNNPQEKQMDLYDNMVGRELADNDAFREMSVDELLEYALREDLLQKQP
jgi:RHS repeat-associated protein